MDRYSTNVEAAARIARDESADTRDRPATHEYEDEGRGTSRTVCQGCDQPLNPDLPTGDPESARLGIGGWWHRHCRETDLEQRHAQIRQSTRPAA